MTKVCLKDKSCKKLYDDQEQKCESVNSWTEESGGQPPMCTDECKRANAKLMNHKIWKGNAACDCGDFENATPQQIRRTEKCFRRRVNLITHCVGVFRRTGGCPEG